MKIAIPFAVEVRNAGQLEARHDDAIGPPVPGQAGDHHRRGVDGAHVRRAHRDRPEPAGEEERRAADRPHDQRLQQPSLGISAHDAERQEHGQHDPEEEGREHRQAEHERPRESACVDSRGRRDVLDVAEDVVVCKPVEPEEAEGQQEDDREHLPPQGFAQAVADDDKDRAHDVSPPTASRYVSSSVEVSARTP